MGVCSRKSVCVGCVLEKESVCVCVLEKESVCGVRSLPSIGLISTN